MYYIPKIFKKLKLSVKKNAYIDPTAKVEGGSTFINSKMGRYSFCGYDCQFINVEIGAFCSISSNVTVGLGHHPVDWVSTSCAFYDGRDSISKRLSKKSFDSYPKKTIIENDVWIGQNVTIMDGVKISSGAIIGTGAVVTKDVGPYEIWVGCPAKRIKTRLPEDIINRLLKSEWWKLPDEDLLKISGFIDDPLKFVEFFDCNGELL